MKTEKIKDTNHQSYNQTSQNPFVIDVKISEVILTPLSCASLINEILKGLLYQKCQIPYPYTWLKNIVDKKRKKEDENEGGKQVNFTLLNHFRVVSKAYDTLENVMKGITKQFSDAENYVKEVIILFGTTPQCPKEVFSISILPLPKGHIERNHIAHLSKYQKKILRNIFLSQNWLDNVDTSINCTNTYIFLKKYETDSNERSGSSEENVFVRVRPLMLPPNLKHVKINLFPDHSTNTNCCENLLVFGDVSQNEIVNENAVVDNDNHNDFVWYQSKDLLPGFKDCYINKISASELW